MTLQGWECPRCGTIWAPHIPKCDCVPTSTAPSRLSIKWVPDDAPTYIRYDWPKSEDLKVTCGSSITVTDSQGDLRVLGTGTMVLTDGKIPYTLT